MMKTPAVLLLLVLAVGLAVPVQADEMNARVRTWGGADLSLSEASVEARYTIRAPGQPSEPSPTVSGGIVGLIPGMISTGSASGGGSSAGAQGGGATYSGSSGTSSGQAAPEPIQGIKTLHAVTLYRGGVEYRVPVSTLSSLTFRRQPVPDSTLPPYFVPGHYRYAATAMLSDGSRVEADYVNLGTAMVRGRGPQGMIEVPWTDIEVIRFSR